MVNTGGGQLFHQYVPTPTGEGGIGKEKKKMKILFRLGSSFYAPL